MALRVTLDLYVQASGRVDKNTQGRTEPYINCFVITLHMRKTPRV